MRPGRRSEWDGRGVINKKAELRKQEQRVGDVDADGDAVNIYKRVLHRERAWPAFFPAPLGRAPVFLLSSHRVSLKLLQLPPPRALILRLLSGLAFLCLLLYFLTRF